MRLPLLREAGSGRSCTPDVPRGRMVVVAAAAAAAAAVVVAAVVVVVVEGRRSVATRHASLSLRGVE